MSLISFRNLIAPLGSKVQIGALLVLAFLAFVVRYQSGGAADTPASSSRARRVITQEEVDLLAAMDDGSQGASPRRKPAPDQDPFLEDAIAGNGAAGQPGAAQPPPTDRRPGGSSLNDIRRTMGLE